MNEKLINKLTRNRNFYMLMKIMNVNYILNNEGISFHKYLAKAFPLILKVLGTSTSPSRFPDFHIELTFLGYQNYIRNAS